MKTFLLALGIAAALFVHNGTGTSLAASPPCASVKDWLVADLQASVGPHQEWIDFLERYPWYPVPFDVGSIDVQRKIIDLYAWRIYATGRAAEGDDTAAQYLIDDFRHHQAIHLGYLDKFTWSGPKFHAWAASHYSQRIATVVWLRNNC